MIAELYTLSRSFSWYLEDLGGGGKIISQCQGELHFYAFHIAGKAEKICLVALIRNINMYFFSVLICLIPLCKFPSVSIHLMQDFWKMRRYVQSRRTEWLFMGESLGQGYGLVYYCILPSLRPLVEICNFHFFREDDFQGCVGVAENVPQGLTSANALLLETSLKDL